MIFNPQIFNLKQFVSDADDINKKLQKRAFNSFQVLNNLWWHH